MAQITFMKLWGYLPTLGYIKKEKSLIFKIAKNVLADRLRKNNFADSLDELESIKCLEVFDDITSVEIQQILLKMSEIDREIVTLKSYGWSSREIGKIKNMPSSTVRNRLAALKKQIEKSLADVESTIIHIRPKSCRAMCPTAFFVQRCLLIFIIFFDRIFLNHKCVNRYVENKRVLTKLKNSVKKGRYLCSKKQSANTQKNRHANLQRKCFSDITGAEQRRLNT